MTIILGGTGPQPIPPTGSSGSGGSGGSGEFSDWTEQFVSDDDNNLIRALAFNAGRFVGVGGGNDPYHSDDGGLNWDSTGTDPGGTWRDMVYADGRYMAVGVKQLVPTYKMAMPSSDGESWDAVETVSGYGEMYGVAYGAGLYVGIGQNGEIQTSPTGGTWTARTSGTTDNLGGITWNGSKFVICCTGGSRRVLSSTDGITWTNHGLLMPLSSIGQIRRLRYLNSKFVAVGDAGVCLSSDGLSWTFHSVPSGFSFLTDAAFGAGKYVATGYAGGGGGNYIIESDDAESWVKKDANIAVPSDMYAVVYADGRFVAAGRAISVPQAVKITIKDYP